MTKKWLNTDFISYCLNRIYFELGINAGIRLKRSKKTDLLSVVIPTIWRSASIEELVKKLSDSIYVGEIILIDNMGSNGRNLANVPKVRVLNAETNLFVNPSWNIGISQANFENIVICNDDITFNAKIFEKIIRVFNFGFGIIGIDKSCLNHKGDDKLWLRYVAYRAFPFGIMMFLKKSCYRLIPDDLKIYGGDNYLFEYVKGPHFAIVGVNITTKMGSSSGGEEFKSIKLKDVELYKTKYKVKGT